MKTTGERDPFLTTGHPENKQEQSGDSLHGRTCLFDRQTGSFESYRRDGSREHCSFLPDF